MERRQTGVGTPGSPASKSRAPEHSQGLGVGLAILTAGGKPGGQQGGARPSAAPAFSASATTARQSNVGSLAVTLPTYAAGNVVLILLYGRFLNNTDTASSAGWTQQGRQANGQEIMWAFSRVMSGSEGATATFSFPNSFETPQAVAATYTGASGVEVPTASQNTPVSSWSLGPITTLGVTRRAVSLVYSFSSNAGTDFTTVGGGATKRVDVAEVGPVGDAIAAMIADVSAPTAGNYSMSGNISASTTWMGVLLAVKP